jgi:glycosyltransferase involved in cell wall biosynthesis
MKILLINKFLYLKGGDAVCALSMGNLLHSKGHEVAYWGMAHPQNPRYPLEHLFVDNVDYNNLGNLFSQIKAAKNILYSFEAKAKLKKVLQVFKPDIVHLHNFAHQISPSILHTLKSAKIPAVMTMHDYKMVCPAYSLLISGTICECTLCQNKAFYHCFLNKCIKGSRSKSFVSTIEMYLHHRILRIYEYIHTFISPSRFLKKEIEKMGFHGNVVYIPNCVDISAFRPQFGSSEKHVVFLGRLAVGKGIFTLIKAFKEITNCSLKIIGEGPLRAEAEQLIRENQIGNVQFLGFKTGEELMEEVRNAMFVVYPSEWYENNPLSIIEAFSLGKPVIGSRIGGIPELIKDYETGLTFEPGNAHDMADKIRTLVNQPDLIVEMGKKARQFVESELNPEQHYSRLMAVYQQAVEKR